jgi:putative restriction endonuclease
MRYWWVNQNQTYRHEVRGGYLWSPKRKTNLAANPFYDFMREVAPGDVVFSFADTLIRAIGIAASHAYEAPKPLEFGQAGASWDKIGWRLDMRFSELWLPIKPSAHMEVLKPLLPDRYAPLRANGAGLQNVYLTRVPDRLAAALVDLLGAEARDLVLGYRVAEQAPITSAIGLFEWEEHELSEVNADTSLPETDRQAIVLARRGQVPFKKRVMKIEHACRITGVNREEHLRASHCKPWRDATNEERLDGENGLLLTRASTTCLTADSSRSKTPARSSSRPWHIENLCSAWASNPTARRRWGSSRQGSGAPCSSTGTTCCSSPAS